MNLGKDVPAVLALLPERPEKERKKGYFGAQVEGWCLARRAEFTDPVDGWQILVDPQQPKEVTARRRRPVRHPRGDGVLSRALASGRVVATPSTCLPDGVEGDDRLRRAPSSRRVPRRSARRSSSTASTSWAPK